MVKSMDVMTGEISYEPVTEIHTNQFDPVGQVTLLDKTDGSETILSVTATHPFYSQDRDWVHASKLMVEDKLVKSGGGTLTVMSVIFDKNAKAAQTYNITVGAYHTYFVGEDGVLVHNGLGSYIIGDGKHWYVGKGDSSRMRTSMRDFARRTGKTPTMFRHFDACSDKSSFKLEHDLMMFATGGKHPKNVDTVLNKILSPGAKR